MAAGAVRDKLLAPSVLFVGLEPVRLAWGGVPVPGISVGFPGAWPTSLELLSLRHAVAGCCRG